MDSIAALTDSAKRRPRNSVAIAILSTLIVYGLTSGHMPLYPVANADSQHMVSVYADGTKRVFATDAATVGEVLDRSNVNLASGDLVEPAASTKIGRGFFNVNVFRARPVMVVDGNSQTRIASAFESPRLMAQAAGLKLYPEDKLETGIITNVVANSAIGVKVDIKRALPLTVKIDGRVKSIRTQSKTVGAALKAAGVALGLKDTVSAPLSQPVVAGMVVTVARVTEVETNVTKVLPREVKSSTDPSLPQGQKVVKTEGADGQNITLFRIHYRDGRETSRETLRQISQIEPVARVEVVGTKVFFRGSVEFWRPEVEAAAAAWGLDPNMMLRIMSCESKGNATVVNSMAVPGSGGQHATGLFQYLPSTWRNAGGTDDNILDGSVQIRITAKKWATYGTSGWACQ